MSTTTTKLVTGVDYVGIPSNDLETARAFYENVLGLEASSVWQQPGKDAVGAEFETGTVTIALINCPALGIPFQTNPAPLALQVADVAQARAALQAQGVAFEHDTIDSGVCHMAHFKDPDGNTLMLHQRYAPKG
jgi:predicted enzyme related to lactoylglutathione lyase